MRNRLVTFLVLLSLGPVLALPATLWHHHADAAVPPHPQLPTVASADQLPTPNSSDDEGSDHCPVCVFCKLIHVNLPTATTVTVEALPAISTPLPATHVALCALPRVIDARGPPAAAPVA